MLNGNDSGVYVLQSPSGKFYVGQTQDFSIRFWQHQNDARINARKYLSHAIRKYGWESFVKIRIPLPEEKWDAVERAWITLLSTNVPRFGYNSTSGGEHAKKHSTTARRKMSEARKAAAKIPEVQEKFLASHRTLEYRLTKREQMLNHPERIRKWNLSGAAARKGKPRREPASERNPRL